MGVLQKRSNTFLNAKWTICIDHGRRVIQVFSQLRAAVCPSAMSRGSQSHQTRGPHGLFSAANPKPSRGAAFRARHAKIQVRFLPRERSKSDLTIFFFTASLEIRVTGFTEDFSDYQSDAQQQPGILKCQRSKTPFREVQCDIYSRLKSCFVSQHLLNAKAFKDLEARVPFQYLKPLCCLFHNT